jgi:hypothetical protein
MGISTFTSKEFAILCRVSGWLAMYRRPQGPQCREDVQFTQPHLSEFVTVAIWLGIMVGPGWFMSELLAFVWKNLWWPTTDQILCFCKHTKRSQKPTKNVDHVNRTGFPMNFPLLCKRLPVSYQLTIHFLYIHKSSNNQSVLLVPAPFNSNVDHNPKKKTINVH